MGYDVKRWWPGKILIVAVVFFPGAAFAADEYRDVSATLDEFGCANAKGDAGWYLDSQGRGSLSEFTFEGLQCGPIFFQNTAPSLPKSSRKKLHAGDWVPVTLKGLGEINIKLLDLSGNVAISMTEEQLQTVGEPPIPGQGAPTAVSMKDCDVETAQKALSDSGFDPGPIDGIWGSATKRALRAFQSAEKLPVSGELDSATCAAIANSRP